MSLFLRIVETSINRHKSHGDVRSEGRTGCIQLLRPLRVSLQELANLCKPSQTNQQWASRGAGNRLSQACVRFQL